MHAMEEMESPCPSIRGVGSVYQFPQCKFLSNSPISHSNSKSTAALECEEEIPESPDLSVGPNELIMAKFEDFDSVSNLSL